MLWSELFYHLCCGLNYSITWSTGELESQKLTVFADVAEDDQKEEGKSGSAIVQAKVFIAACFMCLVRAST